MYDENSNAAAATLVALNNAAAAAAANSTPTAVNSSQLVNQLLTGKDSRWLMLEVCREYQRGQCSRSDLECKFAHPPTTVDVQNGRVTACYDSIKGRCTRDKCKYLHPPQHLKDQLLINGRHHLQLKNHICSQLTQSPAAVAPPPTLTLLAQLMQQQQQQQQAMMPTTLAYQYFSQFPGALYPAMMPTGNEHYQVQTPPPAVLQQLALLQQQQQQQQTLPTPPANPLAAAAAAAAAAASQPNAALIMAILQQQQQQQQQMAAAQALANALAAAGHTSPGMNSVVQSTMPVMSTDTSGSSASSSTSSRKRNAHVAGFDDLMHPSSSSAAGRNQSTSTVASSLGAGGQQGLSVTTTSAAQSAVDSATAASLLQNLQALRQSQMLFATAAANNGVMPQMKRSAMDKNLVPSTTAQIPMYATAQPATQFNPYLQQIPAGYLPAVSFNGALPPRF